MLLVLLRMLLGVLLVLLLLFLFLFLPDLVLFGAARRRRPEQVLRLLLRVLVVGPLPRSDRVVVH